MTDLTYGYLYMMRYDLQVLDTIGTPDYLSGELSDEDVDVPSHMVPPNPDDSDVLPSQVHPSYPYGNPLNLKHPAARPRRPFDPGSRALFEDMGYSGGGVNGSLRWKDLALDTLFPVDEARELAEKAAQARKMASGTSANNPPPPPPPPPPIQPADEEEEEEEVENDENDHEDNENGDDDGSEGESSADEEEA
ncbi:uncharacterized protein LAESUDRAFT_694312 [Laetiporus sulphureus 93-53]|uniref:Uncharacterized protein n=1 Tax=Laetiporus sulphureus 93-53 TaxID=1314785 RepID=A0A165G5A1_9APHY|nr:uncharacterized protein LAESUDRAFT_694312 [Laetiporus sulphureus 93-53]KZT09848.1 hypothetical protein LAESUDRAFT_694312 [Laetiporus sulphureus 93-53]